MLVCGFPVGTAAHATALLIEVQTVIHSVGLRGRRVHPVFCNVVPTEEVVLFVRALVLRNPILSSLVQCSVCFQRCQVTLVWLDGNGVKKYLREGVAEIPRVLRLAGSILDGTHVVVPGDVTVIEPSLSVGIVCYLICHPWHLTQRQRTTVVRALYHQHVRKLLLVAPERRLVSLARAECAKAYELRLAVCCVALEYKELFLFHRHAAFLIARCLRDGVAAHNLFP